MKTLISVIVPCYNQGEYLSDAFDSLIRQTYPTWEAIVVNDGSSDNTEEVALSYVHKDPRIQYVRQENKGVAAARNQGVSKASGEFILPLDPDDMLVPEFMEKCLNEFVQCPQCTLVYTQTYLFGVKNGLWELPSYSDYRSLLLGNCIVCTSLFRKKDFLRIGGYDETMRIGLEDWEFYIRLLNAGSVVRQVPAPLFHYRIKEVSRSTECGKEDNYRKVIFYIYRKHMERYAVYYGNPLEIIQQQRNYERICQKYYNEWYRRFWRGVRRIVLGKK